MKNIQENKSRMYLAVQNFLTANETVVGVLPNYLVLFDEFRTVFGDILKYDEQLQMRRGVKNGGKSVCKSELAELSADMSRRLVAWANFNNEIDLVKQFRFGVSILQRMPDVVLRDTAQGLHNKAKAMGGELAIYGVTDEKLLALRTGIDDFTSLIPKPRLDILHRKEMNLKLVLLFKRANKCLGELDDLIELVRITNDSFYREYKSARAIVDSGKRRLSVKGKIVDASSGKPIKGALARIEGEGGTVLMKASADKGGFVIKTLLAGRYDVTVSKAGYMTVVETMYVTGSVMTVFGVGMEKEDC